MLAFGANHLSPRGLVLSRNYFPGGTNGTIAAPTAVPPPHTADSTNTLSAAQRVAAQIREKGLQPVPRNQVVQLFHDPRFAQDLVVFIDARDSAHYQEGHIPGAYEFDPYRPEKYLATVLPVCHAAEEIVVYCGGGDCEDSQFAALALRDAGVANQKLFVYAGGITDWETNALPVELGERNSRSLRPTAP
jgi:hydroxyacylglutathione hydrolase